MGRIPKPEKKSNSSGIGPKRPEFIPKEEGISFSFEALERTEYFNLDGTCQNWASDMLDMMKEVSKHGEKELISGQFRTYRVHNHEKAKPPSPLPDGVELKDCFQIRISTSKGGIHGVFRENVFFVIWLDPLHNMYPDDRFGGLRQVKPPGTCCKEREDQISDLQEKIRVLQEENQAYKELLDKA